MIIITGSRLVHFGKIADIPVLANPSKTVCLQARIHSILTVPTPGKNIPSALINHKLSSS
jgi:hypothetical protein